MAELNIKDDGRIGFGVYHLDPRWCSFEDFNWFVDKGYFNTYILNFDGGGGTTVGAARKVQETGGKAWLGSGDKGIYFSRKESLSEYMQRIDKTVSIYKEKELWDDTFLGFSFDEPLLKRGHTNQDLYDMTKALYENYGKRIFSVFSAYEVIGKKGNFDDPEGTLILEDFATEYLTDIGHDNYAYDFRVPSTEKMQNKYKEHSEKNPEIYDARTFYKFYFDTLKDRVVNKKAKVWTFPCLYETSTWTGKWSDEDYCIAHLNGLTDLLFEQENIGGVMGYVFKSWSAEHRGLDYNLSRYNPNRWEKLEEAIYKTRERIENASAK